MLCFSLILLICFRVCLFRASLVLLSFYDCSCLCYWSGGHMQHRPAFAKPCAVPAARRACGNTFGGVLLTGHIPVGCLGTQDWHVWRMLCVCVCGDRAHPYERFGISVLLEQSYARVSQTHTWWETKRLGTRLVGPFRLILNTVWKAIVDAPFGTSRTLFSFGSIDGRCRSAPPHPTHTTTHTHTSATLGAISMGDNC